MLGFILLLSYPLFLLIAFVLTAREGTASTSLRGIARWLLAIAFAYGATFGLTLVAVLFLKDTYPNFYYDLGYMGVLYWVQFWRESIGSGLGLLILGLALFALDWLLRRSRKGLPAKQVDNASTSRIAWVFTFAFLIALVLAVFLLIEPYFDSQAHEDQVYAATRGSGLDPRYWLPFSWEGPGTFLYEMAFWVWSFIAFFLMPLVAAQALTLKRAWQRLQGFERIVHTGSATIAGLLSIFMLTIGGFILYWLAD